jgi:4-amino-4-deoxychorismate lyase
MSQLLLETLHIINGQLQHVNWHNERCNRSRQILFGLQEPIDLAWFFAEKWAKGAVPYRHSAADVVDSYERCRFIYDANGIQHIEIVRTPRRIIRSLQLINADDFDYSHKFADRSFFEVLSKNIHADDMLIVKNGFLTDTTYANIVFKDTSGHWFTPSTPLLAGTKRAKLLSENKIEAVDLRPNDISKFVEARLINATTDLENSSKILIGDIFKL